MTVRLALFVVGALLVACAGFFSPWWWTGFAPAGAAVMWLAYNVESEPADGATDTPQPSRR